PEALMTKKEMPRNASPLCDGKTLSWLPVSLFHRNSAVSPARPSATSSDRRRAGAPAIARSSANSAMLRPISSSGSRRSKAPKADQAAARERPPRPAGRTYQPVDRGEEQRRQQAEDHRITAAALACSRRYAPLRRRRGTGALLTSPRHEEDATARMPDAEAPNEARHGAADRAELVRRLGLVAEEAAQVEDVAEQALRPGGMKSSGRTSMISKSVRARNPSISGREKRNSVKPRPRRRHFHTCQRLIRMGFTT